MEKYSQLRLPFLKKIDKNNQHPLRVLHWMCDSVTRISLMKNKKDKQRRRWCEDLGSECFIRLHKKEHEILAEHITG